MIISWYKIIWCYFALIYRTKSRQWALKNIFKKINQLFDNELDKRKEERNKTTKTTRKLNPAIKTGFSQSYWTMWVIEIDCNNYFPYLLKRSRWKAMTRTASVVVLDVEDNYFLFNNDCESWWPDIFRYLSLVIRTFYRSYTLS